MVMPWPLLHVHSMIADLMLVAVIYGGWTGLDQKDNRLHCTIDGEPVVEIDIRASQPTLLSSLLGYKLGGLGPQGEWEDVYGELSRLADNEHWWTVVDDTIDKIELIKRNRNVAKGVVMDSDWQWLAPQVTRQHQN